MKLQKLKRRMSGFTLVEMALVMVIVGLLIGGILKGIEMRANARVNVTIAQVQGYIATAVTFRDRYNALPGDMSNAFARIPGCNATCDPGMAAEASNSIIGMQGWGGAGWPTQTAVPPAAALLGAQAQGETVLFWTHLYHAGLLSGVTRAALLGGSAAWNITHPEAKVGGGFVVGWGDGTPAPGSPMATGDTGMALMLVQSPFSGTVAGLTAPGVQPLTPGMAAVLDRKADDGFADNGYVRAYGVAATCFGNAGSYLENATSRDCGLIFSVAR
ncbi:MAG: prepilin-type N-terminal cleavage/methylation domain-containing protein [Alphaproteobacteria bacterium]|nr:prepilin-type N-terminal cleavage/methylation domain-containing protein [Alphaproteobacteria bacterium]